MTRVQIRLKRVAKARLEVGSLLVGLVDLRGRLHFIDIRGVEFRDGKSRQRDSNLADEMSRHFGLHFIIGQADISLS